MDVFGYRLTQLYGQSSPPAYESTASGNRKRKKQRQDQGQERQQSDEASRSDTSSDTSSDTVSDDEPEDEMIKPGEKFLGFLPGQRVALVPSAVPQKLPKVKGDSTWEEHYNIVQRLLDEANEKDYWNSRDDDAVRKVAELSAQVRALVPAARHVVNGNERGYNLGFDIPEFTNQAATMLIRIRTDVEKNRRFNWRSDIDYAIGVLVPEGTRPRKQEKETYGVI